MNVSIKSVFLFLIERQIMQAVYCTFMDEQVQMRLVVKTVLLHSKQSLKFVPN